MISSSVLTMLLFGGALASPVAKRLPRPFKIAAFGDSFSAGIGAGNFFQGSADGRDNVCARMTGSYPVHLQGLFPSNPTLDFRSCSGDVLDDIDGQVSGLSENVDVATLSISGNDFNFANVVSAAQAACDAELQKSKDSIGDDSIFDKYISKVRLIKDRLNNNGPLFVTGYARFFSPGGSAGDQCDNTAFFKAAWVRRLLGVLPMKFENRSKMNSLVELVNQRIQDKVTSVLQNEMDIVFIDIDEHFAAHRFCEPGRDPWGSNNPRVQFNDLFTTLPEEGAWEGPAHSDDLWVEPIEGPGITEPGLKYRGLTDKFQSNSVFHPKELAHVLTAGQILFEVAKRDTFKELFVQGPNQICKGFGPGGGESCFDIPQNCVGADTVDNTPPVIVCSDGTFTSGEGLPSSEVDDDNDPPLPLTGDNPAGTNVHVNNGCIYIDGNLSCQSGSVHNAAFQNNEVTTITILAKLPSNTQDKQVTAGCKLEAIFPYYYGDIFYGADDCLYDSTGASLAGQCCTDATDDQVDNPYFSG